MKAIADTLGVSRSNLIEQANGDRPVRAHYRKADDAGLLPMLRRIADTRPTYGYRRIGALLNRELVAMSKPPANHKRLYRIMRQNGLLLARHTGTGRQRAHHGTVITRRSNSRWCSDVFEIPCGTGKAVRVAFVLDTCDREIITWVANTRGISGEMVRDLMVEAVEARFGRVPRAPQPIEWLSDNGSCYTARDTVRHAFALGLIPCFTPVQSPESNGMAEAFVKSFKRDYVFVHDRPDALTVLGQLKDWFHDYNEVHPHRGLRMHSPREFIRSQLQAATCPVQ
jgi:transposase InsO family protein